jgi:hypothetical protein
MKLADALRDAARSRKFIPLRVTGVFVCIRWGGMAQTVSLSTRVPPEVRDRLAAEAAGRGVPLATYTRNLLSGALPGDASPGGGDVVAEVEWVFAHQPQEFWLQREICMALARTVEAGGTAGIAAGRELLQMVRAAESLLSYEDEAGVGGG